MFTRIEYQLDNGSFITWFEGSDDNEADDALGRALELPRSVIRVSDGQGNSTDIL